MSCFICKRPIRWYQLRRRGMHFWCRVRVKAEMRADRKAWERLHR